jgi:predicted Na+-dependent transporter
MYNEDSAVIAVLIALVATFGLGYVFGFTMGEQFSQHETIIFCVEKPADCKTKYDYFKLEARK